MAKSVKNDEQYSTRHSGLDPESSSNKLQTKPAAVDMNKTYPSVFSVKIAGQARNDRAIGNNRIGGIALFIALLSTLFSMLEISSLPPINIIPPIESLKILTNHFFTISEQHQAYLYQHFAVSVQPHNYENYIFVALLTVTIFAAVLIIAATKIKLIYALIFFAITALQIYFGVFAAPIWNITLYAIVAWAVLRKANFVPFFSTVVTVALIAFFTFPGASPFLTELSETIRDQFGRQQERHIVMDSAPYQPQNEPPQQQVDTAMSELAGDQELLLQHDEIFAGSQIGTAFGQRIWLLWLIGFAFVIGFALWFLHKLYAAHKRRAVLNSQNCRLAVDAMFKYMMSCVLELGSKPQNLAYARYVTLFPQEQSANYLTIVNLWQKATYSDHAITESDKQQMRVFLYDTQNRLLKGKNPISQAFVRVKWFLKQIQGVTESNNLN